MGPAEPDVIGQSTRELRIDTPRVVPSGSDHPYGRLCHHRRVPGYGLHPELPSLPRTLLSGSYERPSAGKGDRQLDLLPVAVRRDLSGGLHLHLHVVQDGVSARGAYLSAFVADHGCIHSQHIHHALTTVVTSGGSQDQLDPPRPELADGRHVDTTDAMLPVQQGAVQIRADQAYRSISRHLCVARCGSFRYLRLLGRSRIPK